MCGENIDRDTDEELREGSPPRVRGKHIIAAKGTQKERITPACAGKTAEASLVDHIVWDHPRVCGENRARGCLKRFGKGSPPRVRGKRQCCRRKPLLRGITPACAGKTYAPGLLPHEG